MHVPGDPGSCAALARELERAARQVAEAGERPQRPVLPAALWSGVAAARWGESTAARAVRAERLADRLASAGQRLSRFADELSELQLRGSRLASAAAADGLVMTPDGGIPPVCVPHGPFVLPEAVAEQQRAAHRAEVREGLLRQAAVLRAEEDQLHQRLARALQDAGHLPEAGSSPPRGAADDGSGEPADEGSLWAPTRWDSTAGLALVPTATLSAVGAPEHAPLQRVLLAGRTVPVLGVVTAGVGVKGDLKAGYSLPGALAKQSVVVTASSAAGVGVVSALTGGAVATAVGAGAVLTAPVTVPGILVGAAAFGAAAGVGYVGSRLWDLAFKPDAAVRPGARVPRRRDPAPSRVGGRLGLAACAVPLDRTCDSIDVLSNGADSGRGSGPVVSRPR